MEKAIRVVSIERGRDPRQFALVAFGGAGGLHACALAEVLSIPHVIVPAFPGALSALGILWSDVVKDYSRTVLWRVTRELPKTKLAQEFEALEKTAKQDFKREGWGRAPHFIRTIDLRYRGQGYELNLPATGNLLREFETEHRRRYGYAHVKRELEIVTLRLRSTVKSSTPQAADSGSRQVGLGGTPAKEAVIFAERKIAANLYARSELSTKRTYRGPAIVTEYSATSVVPPGKKFRVDSASNLIIEI